MVRIDLKDNVAELTMYANDKTLAKVRTVEFVEVCCDSESYAQDEPGENGEFGNLVIRAASKAKFKAKVNELIDDGWLLQQGV